MRPALVRPALLCLLVGTGCSASKAHVRPDEKPAEKEIVKLEPVKVVANTPNTPDALDVYDAETLFSRGNEFLDNRYYTDARTYFQKLVDEFPDSSYVHAARYNLGVALMESGDAQSALNQFDTYLSTETLDKNILDASFKRGACLAMLGRYKEVILVFDTMLKERDLSPQDRSEALVDSGIAYFMTQDRGTAELRFNDAIKIHREAEREARPDNRYHYAQALFYIGEIERLEFNDYKLVLPDKGGEEKLAAQLEEKCQRLLRAQYKFLQVIKTGHAGWASAAGFKVGTLYEDLHDEMVKLPTPKDLEPDQAEIYRKEIRKKVAVLVRKAIKTYEATVTMARRTGADNVWVAKTEQSLRRMQDLLRDAEDLDRDDVRG
jgi:tetratricopeptide (TPR) repeat protein